MSIFRACYVLFTDSILYFFSLKDMLHILLEGDNFHSLIWITTTHAILCHYPGDTKYINAVVLLLLSFRSC